MATNWTDLTLFEAGDIVLPALFSALPTGAVTNYEVNVKRDFERFIKSKFVGVGKLTTTTTDDFDIEQIENGTILKESALLYNNLLIARQHMTDIEDPSDKYGNYYSGNIKWIEAQIDMDINLLTFALPEGVNQLTSMYTRISQ